MILNVSWSRLISFDLDEIIRSLEKQSCVKINATPDELKKLRDIKKIHIIKYRNLGGRRRSTYGQGKFYAWEVQNVACFVPNLMRENVALKEENSLLKKETKSLKLKLSNSRKRKEIVTPRMQVYRKERAGIAHDSKESPTKTLRRIIHSRVSLRQYASLRGKGMPSASKVQRKERAFRNRAADDVETTSTTASRRRLRTACQETVARAGFSEKPQTLWIKVSGDGTYCR